MLRLSQLRGGVTRIRPAAPRRATIAPPSGNAAAVHQPSPSSARRGCTEDHGKVFEGACVKKLKAGDEKKVTSKR
jgi:hypothetical protein